MGRLLFDIRNGLRVLTRSPGFSLLALLILALGIGANTAIFSLVDGILLKPLPLPQPDRLVAICETGAPMGGYCGASGPNVADLADTSPSLIAAGVARSEASLMQLGEEMEWVSGAFASPGYLQALAVPPQLGRLFAPDENGSGAPKVLVLSDAFWRERYGGDPSVIGRTLTLDDEPHEIIGVLPPGFEAPRLEWVALWAPLPWDLSSSEMRAWRGLNGLGRLAPGVEIETATIELQAIHARLAEAFPAENGEYSVTLRELHEYMVGGTRPMLLLFSGAVGLVLLIVCANMASLLLARGMGRAREMAIRSSLGAGRGHLLSQLMAENGILAVLGGGLGVLVAFWGVDLFLVLAPPSIPRQDEIGVGGGVLVFAVLTTLGATLMFGLLPSLRAARADLAQALRDGGRTGSRKAPERLRRALVVTEVAMAFVLLAGAGLLTRSFLSFTAWDPGFDTHSVLTTQVFAPFSRYPEEDQVAQVYMDARDAVAALPGVISVGMVSSGPLFGGMETSPFSVPGREPSDPSDRPNLHWYDADPHYFATLGLPILQGRGLETADVLGGPPVAVINETLARLAFGSEDPIGRVIDVEDRTGEMTVVGVVADVPPFTPGVAPNPEIYWSNRQFPRWGSFFLIRTAVDPASVVESIGDGFAEVDPTLQIGNVASLEDRIARRLVTPRFNMALLGIFGIAALVLSLAGVYGVMSLLVALRTKEIGIRMALGAPRDRILAGIVWESLTLVLMGLGIGVLGALAAGGLIRGMVYGISVSDPVSLVGSAAVLAAAGILAGVLPARRASRVDVVRVLRED